MPEYIERKAALRKIAANRTQFDTRSDAEYAEMLLFGVPAADVEVVRQGRWVEYECDEPYGPYDTKAWYKCSECGKDAFGRCWDDEWYSCPVLSDYCPHCGAKTHGKGDDK